MEHLVELPATLAPRVPLDPMETPAVPDSLATVVTMVDQEV